MDGGATKNPKRARKLTPVALTDAPEICWVAYYDLTALPEYPAPWGIF